MAHQRRRVARENPLSLSTTQQWLLLGFGGVVLGSFGYLFYVAYQSTKSWPPSADVQQGILNQILSANQAMGGQPPSADQSAQLAASVQQAATTYAASLPAGQTPTVAGYQAWMSANVSNYVAQGGASGGFGPSLTS